MRDQQNLQRLDVARVQRRSTTMNSDQIRFDRLRQSLLLAVAKARLPAFSVAPRKRSPGEEPR